ncbi:zinc transport system substrate-binding protein [Palleronia salina]|uniref:High-affinity zinc uptake system protein ZnuA n=1 Tax=Palleronia salina TaxID=313368 RepID=A0A1M6BE96_9RHOB|nr:zinc ABC transporter substrate-binding protein [Palleronia salina]SHI47039.1 zinc transport system substrate-binding protein [Palleronia salina]
MSMKLGLPLSGVVLSAFVATGAAAEVPRVATDIAPVHGLVARVMEGLGTPEMIVEAGASPHGYSMRPSEARALERAEAVFWVGSALEPWLEGAIETLAEGAAVIELLDAPETRTLAFREGARFDAHAHGDEEHDGGDDHGHDAHDEGGHADHDDHAEAEDHAGEESHADHEGHDHDGIDPHAWLDPENGKAWLGVIADTLADLDPENAETYRANAEAGQSEIDAAVADVRDMLSAAEGISFIVFHDAFQYFESRFDIAAAGAISLSDASDPGPARIAEVQETVRDLGVTCVLAEPQFNRQLVDTVTEGTEARAAVLDPLGVDLEAGPGFYPALIRTLGSGIADCANAP